MMKKIWNGIWYFLLACVGSSAIFQSGGRLPNSNSRIPKAEQLHVRLDSPNPSRRVLERPAPPQVLCTRSVPSSTGFHLRRTQRPPRRRGPQHLHSGPLSPLSHSPARLGRVAPAQLGDGVQGTAHHPRRALRHRTAPVLHRDGPKVRVPAGPFRSAGCSAVEPRPIERGEVQALQAGVSRPVRRGRDDGPEQRVELDPLGQWDLGALRCEWGLGKGLGEDFWSSCWEENECWAKASLGFDGGQVHCWF